LVVLQQPNNIKTPFNRHIWKLWRSTRFPIPKSKAPTCNCSSVYYIKFEKYVWNRGWVPISFREYAGALINSAVTLYPSSLDEDTKKNGLEDFSGFQMIMESITFHAQIY